MNKQKAIEIIKDAPAGWGYYSERADNFFCKGLSLWCVFDCNRGGWGVCEPSIRAERDMMPKSEILKVAEVEPLKNAGDNLVLGCEDSKCDEWPQVGDDALLMTGMCTVKSTTDKHGVLAVVTKKGLNMLVHKSDVKKPKTPEEELRDEIKQEVFSNFIIMPELLSKRDVTISISECIANELARKYNITKKPQ